MSDFTVTVREVPKVVKHSNADALDIIPFDDYQVIVKRGQYGVGDKVVFFPYDSVLPDVLKEKLELPKNRIKTVKLRGEISQGMIMPLNFSASVGTDVTEYLGVHKYEPEEKITQAGKVSGLPDGVEVYDIENCEKEQDTLNELYAQKVHISEKLEGTHISILVRDGDTYVNTRRTNLLEEENVYYRTAKKQGLLDLAKYLSTYYGDEVLVRGELVGPKIQGNIYKLEEHRIYVFDISVGQKYLAPCHYIDWPILLAPALFIGQLTEYLLTRSLKDVSSHPSTLNPSTWREGIVIRSYHNGRPILKQKSPEYLAGSNL